MSVGADGASEGRAEALRVDLRTLDPHRVAGRRLLLLLREELLLLLRVGVRLLRQEADDGQLELVPRLGGGGGGGAGPRELLRKEQAQA